MGEAFDAEDRRQKLIADKIKNKKRIQMENEMEESSTEEVEAEAQDVKESSQAKGTEQNCDPNKRKHRRKRKRKCCEFDPNSPIMRCSKAVETLVEGDWFSNLILIFICINTVVLAAEFYKMPEWLQKSSEIANYIFTFIFFAEMVLKIFGLGLRKYLADGFNIFDCVIVWLSMIELFQSTSENSGLSVLRAFRLLRIFKIIKSWTSLRILLSTVLQSLSAITNLGFLTMLYLFISALLAK